MLSRKRRRPKVGKSRGEDKNKSWLPKQKSRGGEALSHGYGSSVGGGQGASGPEKQPKKPDDPGADAVADKAHRDRDDSPALPSRDRIAKVLR